MTNKAAEVSREEFEKRIKKLRPIIKTQIENVLLKDDKEIVKFLYGKAPNGERIYEIVYSGGMTRTWRTIK